MIVSLTLVFDRRSDCVHLDPPTNDSNENRIEDAIPRSQYSVRYGALGRPPTGLSLKALGEVALLANSLLAVSIFPSYSQLSQHPLMGSDSSLGHAWGIDQSIESFEEASLKP